MSGVHLRADCLPSVHQLLLRSQALCQWLLQACPQDPSPGVEETNHPDPEYPWEVGCHARVHSPPCDQSSWPDREQARHTTATCCGHCQDDSSPGARRALKSSGPSTAIRGSFLEEVTPGSPCNFLYLPVNRLPASPLTPTGRPQKPTGPQMRAQGACGTGVPIAWSAVMCGSS